MLMGASSHERHEELAETAAADAETTFYAWAGRGPAEGEIPTGGNRLVIAVAVLAAVGAIAAVVAAAVSLTAPRPEPGRYVPRPAPVEQMQPPKPPAPKPPPSVVAAPPVQHLQVPPDARQRFSALLAQGRIRQTDANDDDQQAKALCRDLSEGQSVEGYITGTVQKSTEMTRREARQVIFDAITAYCPQYLGR
jgi:hypothetical protein